jgi:hypothetical protein
MLEATVSNMRKFEDRRDVFAYSPVTHEEYSATPGDYWTMPDDEPLLDQDGVPMILVRRTCNIDPL